MHHGDGLTSVLSGMLLSITANAAGWVGDEGFALHAATTLLYGFVGGIGGLAARWTVRAIREARISNNNKDNNNPR